MSDEMAAVAFADAGRRDAPVGLRASAPLFVGLIAANVAAWTWAWVAFHDHPASLGIALLAWVFGLRHAVDADHIAAIDNVVRKLMQDGQTTAVGRAVVLARPFDDGRAGVAGDRRGGRAPSRAASPPPGGRRRHRHDRFGRVLLAIALANLVVLRGVWRSFREVRAAGSLDEDALDMLLAGRGLLARLFRPLFRAVTAAGTCTRWASCSAWASTPQPKSVCWGLLRPRRRRACRRGSPWCFPPCSPPAWHWWTRRTAC